MQNVSEMSKADRLPSRSEDAQIAARIHNARPHPGVLQRLDGAIDGKTFRDAAEINRKRAAKHHRSRFPIENNIAPVPLETNLSVVTSNAPSVRAART
jgi:hypothetical protein